jgi:hypothetical protein
MDTQASMLPDGTLVTTPVSYGKDSETLNHGDSKFRSLYMRSNIQAYIRRFGTISPVGFFVFEESRVVHIVDNGVVAETVASTVESKI